MPDYRLEPIAEAQIAPAALIWMAGWQEAHADLVPPALTRLQTAGDFLHRLRANRDGTRVALLNGEVLGLCMVKGDELYQMYVAPTARGTGIAGGLLQEAERRIADQGHRAAWLSCAIGNARAARFYEKAGWTNAGPRTAVLDTTGGVFPLECWRFEKLLA